jgi:anti-sigma factor RsiW
MSEHLSDENIEAYRGRRLPAAELLSASSHLAACEACRVRVSSPKELHRGFEAIRAVLDAEANTAHLTYDEIARYVDGQLPTEDGARVELHARECPPCADDIEGIQALRIELDAPPAKQRPWGRLADLWRTGLNWKGSLVLAGAAGCALLVVLVVRGPGPRGGASAGVSTGASTSAPEPRQPAQTATVNSIRDGKRLISIAAGGVITGLDGLSDSDRAALERVLAAKRVDAPASIAGLARGAGVLLGSQAQAPRAVLLGPVGRVVETDRPVLRWKPVAGARFLVSVFDSRYNEMASSGWIPEAEWRVPRALGRGVVYSWQLNVRQNGAEFTVPAPPAPEARFRILSAAEEADLIRVRGTSGDSHLVLGLQYARAGLLDEAGQELRTLREQNPGSETVAALLDSVERLRRAPSGGGAGR